jgi:hypothetical protein
MLDLQTKSVIDSDKLQVQHQATSRASRITDTKHLSQHPDNIQILHTGKVSGSSIAII